MRAVELFIIFGILNCLSMTLVAGVCCPKFKFLEGSNLCAEGDIVGQGFYCGKKGCNLFGCNCGDGCREVGPIKRFDILGVKNTLGYNVLIALNETHCIRKVAEQMQIDPISDFQSYFDNGKVVRLNKRYQSNSQDSENFSQDLARMEGDIGTEHLDVAETIYKGVLRKVVFGDLSLDVFKKIIGFYTGWSKL